MSVLDAVGPKSQYHQFINIAELVNASVVLSRDPGSNLDKDRKYFFLVFVAFE
jgi:hypothetical protein